MINAKEARTTLSTSNLAAVPNIYNKHDFDCATMSNTIPELRSALFDVFILKGFQSIYLKVVRGKVLHKMWQISSYNEFYKDKMKNLENIYKFMSNLICPFLSASHHCKFSFRQAIHISYCVYTCVYYLWTCLLHPAKHSNITL